MTPKEKALKICQEFGKSTLFHETFNEGRTLPLDIAKLFALICVEEIINSQWALSPFSEKGTPWTLYWQSVKTEIEKL